MITPVRIPETPVILHRPQAGVEEDSVSVDTAKTARTPSEKQKKSPSPSRLSSKTNPSQGSDLEELEMEQELEELVELEEDGVVSSVKDVPVATLVSTA